MEGRLLSGSDDGLVCYWDLKGAEQTVDATQKFGELKKSPFIPLQAVRHIVIFLNFMNWNGNPDQALLLWG